MPERVRIAVDAMGGDLGPRVNVEGAVAAVTRDSALEVILVGDKAEIERRLAAVPAAERASLSVQPASQVVEMAEVPVQAVRSKPDNSMSVGMRLVRDGKADGFVTAGNTGAALAAALFELGRIEGIRRPALATLMPGVSGSYLLLDIGANADCRPQDLVQFALMGHVYAKRGLGIASPRIGLVSNGEEESKGNELTKEAHILLRGSGLNFVGNVEGKDLPNGLADVVVTDGFTGNVMIKTSEGVASMILEILKRQIARSWRAKLGGLLLRPTLKAAVAHLDYTEVGGAPLLGVRGVVLVGHGRSNAKAIASLISAGARVARQGLVAAIADGLKENASIGNQVA